ncbi:MAG: stage II sporulation protein R [Firmicutes bacterium]|nr:stage II sporulation protein R [Alicyclobacillaceae bacterium]MCL6497757.1 stage II sporulation protein R [Bacillota bacterium]
MKTHPFPPPPRPSEVIRLRVIAHSDHPRDQAAKLTVRDRLLARLRPALEPCASREAAWTAVKGLAPRLAQEAQAALAEAGLAYGATVAVGTAAFPAKAYGPWIFPAGPYAAVVVTLGAGEGQNWWCLIYPALCFIDLAHGVAVPPMGTLPPAHMTVSWGVGKILQTLSRWW